MLGKLMKHELRATARVMLPILGALLLVSVAAHFSFLNLDRDLPTFLKLITILVVFLFFAGLFAVGVINVVIMILRFGKNFLKDEGYIMHTLPVSVHALVWSKILVSAIWFAATATGIVAALSIALLNVEFLQELGESIKLGYRLLVEEGGLVINGVELVAESAALTILGLLSVGLPFYAAMSLGYGFAKHKTLYSVLIYIGFNLIMQYVSGLVTTGLVLADQLSFINYPDDFMSWWRFTCGESLILSLVSSAVFYLITVYSLKRRLNLE